MSNYNVAETFLSINGEGTKAGQLAFFIRFTGCNLKCGYCDTAWANQPGAPFTPMSQEALYMALKESGAENVTITGGEPLLQEDIYSLLALFCRDPQLYVEVETNGSLPLKPFMDIPNRPAFTMDYKLPGSGMERFMYPENFDVLDKRDTVKFVCGSREDLNRALEIIQEYQLSHRTSVYLSPVFGKIQPAEIVEFMKENRLTGVTLQLQLHKFIWDPEQRGV